MNERRAQLPLTAIVADDEPVLRLHLQRILADLAPQLEVVATAANGDEAWRLVQQHRPNVIFLDIRMPGRSGLAVAHAMHESGMTRATAIVFLTAYDEHAVEAFQHEAIDYLLKPLEERRLLQTLARLESRQAESAKTPDLTALLARLEQATPAPALRWIRAAKGEAVHVIAVEDVLMFHAADKYTSVITKSGEYLIRQSLRQLSAALDPDAFWRVHRSTLVRVAAIEKVTRTMTGRPVLYLQGWRKPVAVSRRFSEQFKPL